MSVTEAVPPEHFSRILQLLQQSPVKEAMIRDKQDRLCRFVLEGEQVFMCDVNETTGEETNRREVVNVDSIPELRRAVDPIMQRLREEFPEMSEEQLEEEAEGIKAFDKAIQEMKCVGISEELAFRILKSIEESDLKDITSPEQLAQLFRDREMKFSEES